jgi:hypothetical protein
MLNRLRRTASVSNGFPSAESPLHFDQKWIPHVAQPLHSHENGRRFSRYKRVPGLQVEPLRILFSACQLNITAWIYFPYSITLKLFFTAAVISANCLASRYRLVIWRYTANLENSWELNFCCYRLRVDMLCCFLVFYPRNCINHLCKPCTFSNI